MGLDICGVGGRSYAPLHHDNAPQTSHLQLSFVSLFSVNCVFKTVCCSPKENKVGRKDGEEEEPRKLSQYSRINPAFEFQN